MKKKFVEPEIVRIDVKMTENIATSQKPYVYPYQFYYTFWITVQMNYINCKEEYVDTGLKVIPGKDLEMMELAVVMGPCHLED